MRWAKIVAMLAVLGFATPGFAVEIKIGHAGAQVFRLPLYIAILKGYFKEEGIDLQVVDTRSGSDADMMLAGGAVEFVTAPLIDNVNLNKQGIHAVGVATLFDRFNNSIIVPKRLEGTIRSFADLKGRPLGVTGIGSGTWQFALFMAHKTGLKREDLNLIATGTGAGVTAAVESGRVDGMSYADPEGYQLVASGKGLFLVDMTDDAEHKKYVGATALFSHIFTTKDYISKHPEVVQSFVNAIQKAIVWDKKHSPEEVADLLLKYPAFGRQDRDVMISVLKRARPGLPSSAVISKEAFDNAMAVPVAIGALQEPMKFEQLVDNKFAEKAANNIK